MDPRSSNGPGPANDGQGQDGSSLAAPETPWPPYQKGDNFPGAGALGMRIFVASLAVPFGACVIGFLCVRALNPTWPPPGAPPIPDILWLSTVAILATSVSAHLAVRAVRDENQSRLRVWAMVTMALGFVFFACQGLAWAQMAAALPPMPDAVKPDASADPESGLRHYAGMFYLFTIFHAVHVGGGLIFQGIVTARAFRGLHRYFHHPGILHVATYWHFVDAAWLVVFVTLLLGN